MVPLLLVATVAAAADGPDLDYVGRKVSDVIDTFRDAGHPFVYSTSLVSEELVVETEPAPGTPLQLVTQILQPHGLTLSTEAGVYLVVRIPRGPIDRADHRVRIIVIAIDLEEYENQPQPNNRVSNNRK